MIAKILGPLVSILIQSLGKELLKAFADVLLDFIDQRVEASETQIDDAIVLPITQAIRGLLEIEEPDTTLATTPEPATKEVPS